MDQTAEQLTVSVERRGSTTVVHLGGRTTPNDAETFERMVVETLGSAPKIVVLDLSGLTHLASFGIGGIIRLHTQACDTGGAVRLCGLRDEVLGVLRNARLDERLPVYHDLAAALAGAR